MCVCVCVCFVQPVVQPAEKCKRTFTVVLLQSKKLKKQNVGGTSIAVNSYTAKPTRVSRRLFLGAVLHSVLHKATVSSVVVSGQQETIGLLALHSTHRQTFCTVKRCRCQRATTHSTSTVGVDKRRRK